MSELFRVMGSISVDTREFMTAMDNAIQRATQLSDTINGINGMTANVNINQTGSNGAALNVVPAASGGNATGNAANADTDDDEAYTGNANARTAAAAAMTTAVNGGWTIFRGIVANLATQAINWGIKEGQEFYAKGMERVATRDAFVARLRTTQGMTQGEAEAAYAEIDEFAFNTPLDSNDTIQVAGQLLATGVDYPDLIPTMQMLGDIAMGDSNVMRGIAGGYTDIMATGVVTAQDARQFTTRGIPIWDIMADYFNSEDSPYQGSYRGLWADGDDIKAANRNKYPITSKDFRAALEWATSENGDYYNAMNNMMDTYAGRKEMHDDSMARAAGAFAEPFARVFKDEVYPTLTEQNAEFAEILQNGSVTIDRMARTVGNMWIGLNGIRNDAAEIVLNAEERNPGATGEAAALGATYLAGMGMNPAFAIPAIIAGIGYDIAAVKTHADEQGQGFWETLWQDKFKDDVDYFLHPFKQGWANLKKNVPAMIEDWSNFIDWINPFVVPVDMPPDDHNRQAIDAIATGRPELMLHVAATPPAGDTASFLLPNGKRDKNLLMGGALRDYADGAGFAFGSPVASEFGKIIEWLTEPTATPTGTPGGEFFENIHSDVRYGLPGTPEYSSLMAQLQNMPQQITAAVQEGMNGVTITANVTTGDVRLQDGTIVGALTPKINLLLGAMNASSSRG